ncbi:glycosyltransferase family 4 protein [Aliiroseovarius sp. CAU 1755]
MRLLLIHGGFGAGGAEKIVSMIATHRLEMGDEVSVLGFDMPDGGSYFPYPETAKLIVAKQGSGLAPLSKLQSIQHAIRQSKPDLVLSFLTKINVLSLLAAMRGGPPVVISERNNPRAQKANPVWRHAQNVLARRAAAVVMQTERARCDLPRAIANRATVIPNPCAPYTNLTVAPDANGLRLAAVGRLDQQKGFDLLLKAMPAVRDTYPKVRLTIQGEGPERPRLEALRDKLGLAEIVSLPGASPAPGAWLQTADILVVPSRFEGFPNVIAEAAVSGLPVIAFDCDYGPREIITDGKNGLLVEPNDIPALSRSILRLIGDPALRAQMAKASGPTHAALAPDQVLGTWDQVIGSAMKEETQLLDA